MTDASHKPWYQSLTIRALIVAVLAQVLVFFDVGEKSATGYASQATEAILQAVELASLAVAAYGRKRATEPLSMKRKVPND